MQALQLAMVALSPCCLVRELTARAVGGYGTVDRCCYYSHCPFAPAFASNSMSTCFSCGSLRKAELSVRARWQVPPLIPPPIWINMPLPCPLLWPHWRRASMPLLFSRRAYGDGVHLVWKRRHVVSDWVRSVYDRAVTVHIISPRLLAPGDLFTAWSVGFGAVLYPITLADFIIAGLPRVVLSPHRH